jgi:hypothetical protein
VEGQPFPVTITAVDGQGQPLGGYSEKVQLNSQFTPIKPTSIQFANGSWSGLVTVYGNANGLVLNAYGWAMNGGSSAPFTVIGPGGQSASLSGRVLDLTGAALVNANVYLNESDGGGKFTTVTDGNGRYAFDSLATGPYALWAVYGSDPRESRRKYPTLTSYGPQTQDIEINVYPVGIPVVLVPGVLGSKTDSTWQGIPYLPAQYPADAESLELHDPYYLVGWSDLMDALRASGFSTYAAPYDWRAPVKEVAEKYLKPAIDLAKQETGSPTVYIVAHSTGGLAARYYIQNLQQADTGGDVAKLAMVGTPHLGAVNAYYVWSGGDPKGADDINDSGPTSVVNLYWNSIKGLYEDTYKLGHLNANDWQKIYGFLHSLQLGAERVGAELHDLLPTFKFLHYEGSEDWDLTSADNTNHTLIDLNADPNRSKRMTKDGVGGTVRSAVFYSQSQPTIASHEVNPPVPSFDFYGARYADGAPSPPRSGNPVRTNGDGTVLESSAMLPCAEGWANCYLVADAEHGSLVKKAKTQIRDFLTEGQSTGPALVQRPTAAASVTTGLSVSVQGRVRPYLVTPEGTKAGVNPVTGLVEEGIPGAQLVLYAQDGGLALDNPGNGNYQVSISGAAQEEVRVSLSYFSGTVSKEIKVRLFHHGGTSVLAFQLDGAVAEPLTLSQLPAPPIDARAEAVENGGWATRITWQASVTPGVNGYRVYGRGVDEPFMAMLAETSGLMVDTAAPWAGENAAPVRIFAVTALLPDGRESVLTDLFQNDDRDHDGLDDSTEAALGTNPNLADSDGDGLSDSQELGRGTNPVHADSDGDGVPDGQDRFPLEAAEWLDTDGDGIGNNADPDDDNDGVVDALDAFPLDRTEWLDTDHDGIGNNADTDDDNDGIADTADNCPLVANPDQADRDGDGIGDACDSVYGGCQTGALTVGPIIYGAGALTLAAGQGLITQGAVQLLTGADVTFRAPRLRFGNGFRVAAGAHFQTRAEAVTCGDTLGGESLLDPGR